MMYEEATQVAADAVGNIRTVASFCAEGKVFNLYQNKCNGPRRTGIRRGLISGFSFGVSFFFLFSVYATIFYAGARLLERGKITFSEVYRLEFLRQVRWHQISAKPRPISIFAILDEISKLDLSDASGITLEGLKGEIEFPN
ncbi:hypothetical protein MKW94_023395, partial [Papaver nudicaule]|nr:hypothetical protein [Papaver nudicaule]MCL7040136.1 hypothetical protein [Papaver nudicaule]